MSVLQQGQDLSFVEFPSVETAREEAPGRMIISAVAGWKIEVTQEPGLGGHMPWADCIHETYGRVLINLTTAYAVGLMPDEPAEGSKH